jgi:hypothetical protein
MVVYRLTYLIYRIIAKSCPNDPEGKSIGVVAILQLETYNYIS